MRSPRLICEHLPDDRIDVDKWRILPESQSYRLQGRREIRHFLTLMLTAHDISQNITAVAVFRPPAAFARIAQHRYNPTSSSSRELDGARSRRWSCTTHPSSATAHSEHRSLCSMCLQESFEVGGTGARQ